MFSVVLWSIKVLFGKFKMCSEAASSVSTTLDTMLHATMHHDLHMVGS